MEISGALRKMHTQADENGLVNYTLPIGEQLVDMSSLIGQQISVSFDGDIHCVHCAKKLKEL